MTDPKELAEQVTTDYCKRTPFRMDSSPRDEMEKTALAAIEARDREWRELIQSKQRFAHNVDLATAYDLLLEDSGHPNSDTL